MEKKCLLQYLRDEAGNDQQSAVRVCKTLAANGIYTIDLLMAKTPNELTAIKGIGDKAMNLIGRVMTKEAYERKNKKDIYKKYTSECPPTTLRDWFQKAGCSYLEACTIQKILKKNGIKDVEQFRETSIDVFKEFKGIGDKRLETIESVNKMMRKKPRAKKA